MLKCQNVSKTILKYLHALENEQYQSWKWLNYTQWADCSFRPIIIIEVIFIIIKLSIVANNQILWIILGAQILVHLILFLCLPKIIQKGSYLLQIVPFIQQECISVLCYFANNESYLILYTATCIIFQTMYSTIRWKTIAIIFYLFQTILLADLQSYEGLYLSIILQIMQIIRIEYQQIQNFLNLQALFLIIDSTPQAICIAHKDKNWLLYSNKEFDNLAYKLENTNQSETDYSPEKRETSNFTKNQQTFLQKLQLSEFNNNQKATEYDLDDDALYLDDQYKINEVIYSKDKNEISNLNLEDRPKNHDQFKKFFQSFKRLEDPSTVHKKFTSDVKINIEVKNPPLILLASNRSFNYRFRLPNQTQELQNQIALSRRTSTDRLLQGQQNRNSTHQQSLLNQEKNFINKQQPVHIHQMKFLINVLENQRFFDNDDELQIYFIHKVNQELLRKKLKKQELINKNLRKFISHSMIPKINSVYCFIKLGQDKLLQQESCHIQLEQALIHTKLQFYKMCDYFDYLAILEGSIELKYDKFDVNTVISECVEFLRHDIEKKLLIINVELPKTSSIIIGDRQRLFQVFLNLIENSIKFTIKGEINIIVQKKQQIEGIDLNSVNFEDNNFLDIYVNDTGVGMTEKELRILREKLQQTDEDEQVCKHPRAIGLGLSVCKQIIKLMSPKIQNYLSVKSKSNEGTQFNFLLKYIEDSNQNSNLLQQSNNHTIPNVDAQMIQQVRVMNCNKLNNPQITNTLGQLNECNCKIVLIVDDEQFSIEVLSYLIKQLGFEIDFAYDGKQAIAKLQNQLVKRCNSQNCIGYNCILMDINMPVMNGWEAVKRIRQIEKEIHLPRAIPIIAVTGFRGSKDQQKSLKEGYDSVLIKPVTKELLIDIFNQFNI